MCLCMCGLFSLPWVELEIVINPGMTADDLTHVHAAEGTPRMS